MLHLSPFAWLVVALAAYRLTRLVTTDRIASFVRDVRWPGEDEDASRAGLKWTTFITCPWCVGFWICVAVGTASLLWWSEVQYLWIMLALSAIVGLVAERS